MRNFVVVLLTTYYLRDNIKNNEMKGAYETYGRQERCIQGLVGRPDRKTPFGRPKCRWKDNIKIDLQEIGWAIMGCIDLAQDRDRMLALVNVVMNHRFP
jgi:hypothetical protein